MSKSTNPYIKHNRRTDTYSVYAYIEGKRKVIARVKYEFQAIEIRDKAKLGIIETSNYSQNSDV